MINGTNIIISNDSLNNVIIPSTYIIAASSTVIISNITETFINKILVNKTNSTDIIKSISNNAYKLKNYLTSFYIFTNLSILFASYI